MTVLDLHTRLSVELPQNESFLLALGNFDGVHIGHQQLFKATVQLKQAFPNAKTAVWTFDQPPNPLIPYLTTLEDKLDLFEKAGMEYAFLERFETVRDNTPHQFTQDILIKACHCVAAVCGFNFTYGKMGAGTATMLVQSLQQWQVKTVIIPPVLQEGKIVSSTRIRFLIENGQMEEAALLLGRPFSIQFPVVYGKQLGRTIGIPTINQSFPPHHIIPKRGIYSCTCSVEDDIFLGVSNIGSRPTVNDNASLINCETHIIHYNGWLYGKKIKVSFYKKIRDEHKFGTLEELKQTIQGDIATTIAYFSKK